jgi:hypothetical protein
MGMPIGLPGGGGPPMMAPNGIPMVGPNPIPMGPGPIGGPIPMAQMPAFGMPGVANISPPLMNMPGGFQGIPAAMIGAQPIPAPKLPGPGDRIGLPQFGAGDGGGGGGGGGPNVVRLPGMGVDIPWGWNG